MKIVFPPIFEFGNIMVYEPGIPNRERVVFRPTETVDLSRYGVWIAIQGEDGSVTPVANTFFWFGTREVSPPCWIVLFSGKGEFKILPHQQTNDPVYCFHWGNEHTLFTSIKIIPVIFRFDAFSKGQFMTPATNRRVLPNPGTQK